MWNVCLLFLSSPLDFPDLDQGPWPGIHLILTVDQRQLRKFLTWLFRGGRPGVQGQALDSGQKFICRGFKSGLLRVLGLFGPSLIAPSVTIL